MEILSKAKTGTVTFSIPAEEVVWLELSARMGLVMDPVLHFGFSATDILHLHGVTTKLRISHSDRPDEAELTLPFEDAKNLLIYLTSTLSAYSPNTLCPQIADQFPVSATLDEFVDQLRKIKSELFAESRKGQ